MDWFSAGLARTLAAGARRVRVRPSMRFSSQAHPQTKRSQNGRDLLALAAADARSYLGPYFLEVFDWLFRENRIAAGRFHALGRLVDLA